MQELPVLVSAEYLPLARGHGRYDHTNNTRVPSYGMEEPPSGSATSHPLGLLATTNLLLVSPTPNSAPVTTIIAKIYN